jgi:hypothetical protein
MPGAIAAAGAWIGANSSWLVPTTLAVGAVGGGISAYNSYQQGKTAQRIAQFNHAAQMKNAQMQQRMGIAQMQAGLAQSRVMESMARINQALASSEANARIANAEQMRKNAEAQTGFDRENIRRERENFARLTARQRATIAGSGIVESGSPLELLADTAGEMQQALNEQHLQSDIGRRKAFAEAGMEEFGGRLALAGAQADYAGNIAEAGFARTAAQLDGAAARAGYSASRRQANIDFMSGMSTAKGLKTGAWGSLLSTVGDLGGAVGQWTNWGQKSTGYHTYGVS